MQSILGSGLIRAMAGERKNQPSSSVDQIWNDFISMNPNRGLKDYVSLITDPEIDEVYQQRAMQVLLVPSVSRLPFEPKKIDRYGESFLDQSDKWIGNINSQQAQYAASLVSGYISEINNELVDKDKASDIYEEAYYSSLSRDLITYNQLIIELLDKLPMYEASKLFDSFKINDISPYWNMDTFSGYNPLRQLYLNQNIDITWKRRASHDMHHIIIAEQNGETQPRRDHEAAFIRNKEILDYMAMSAPETRTLDFIKFFEDEVGFMLMVNQDDEVISPWNLTRALDMIDESATRYQLVKRVILRDDSGYSLNNNVDVEVAQMLVEEFLFDEKIVSAIELKLKQRDMVIEAASLAKKEVDEEEKQARSRMKRSSDTIS